MVWRDAEGGDDRDLLEHQGDVLRGDEAGVEEPEHDARQDQHDERAERRMGVQLALNGSSGVSRGVRLFELLLRREDCRCVGHGLTLVRV